MRDRSGLCGSRAKAEVRVTPELSRDLKTVNIKKAVDSIDNDDAWPGFLAFMKLYLDFFRCVNYGNLLETPNQLSVLVK